VFNHGAEAAPHERMEQPIKTILDFLFPYLILSPISKRALSILHFLGVDMTAMTQKSFVQSNAN
jgi:hypothetical protein